MNRSAIMLSASLMLVTAMANPGASVSARGHEGGGGGGGGGGRPPEQQRSAPQQQRSAPQAEQQNARRAQEEASRAQEENARQGQQRAQQDAQRRQQEQQQRQQQGQQRQQQDQQRQQQRDMQEQQKRQQQGQQEQLKLQEKEQQQEQRNEQKQERSQGPEPQIEGRPQPAPNFHGGNERQTPQGEQLNSENGRRAMNAGRAVEPRRLNENPALVRKAVSMPVLEKNNLSPSEREHAQAVIGNMQHHLIPVPQAQIPQNFTDLGHSSVNNYLNNYQTNFNNQPLIINRQNTFYNPYNFNQYPFWYQPQPGWVFTNGFVLGNSVRCGLDWLRWGWHPYYGPEPDGFICAQDYVPTPWIYFPAYGLWRIAGSNGWAEGPPDYDYAAPISVEVMEPRVVSARDPYTGWVTNQSINAVYLYNAFYDPEMGRYGYMNQHGYFIWLNF